MSIQQRLENESTPLIDGQTVTFVWEGEDPPLLRGDFNGWTQDPTEAPTWTEEEPGLWLHRLTLPDDAYIEYGLGTDEDRQLDPHNPRVTPNGMGQMNHYFAMPQAELNLWHVRKQGVVRGRVTHHRVTAQLLARGKTRDVYLYQPPTEQPVPLLLVYDGQDYYRRAQLPTIVDNLIAQAKIPPIALAMIANAGPQARMTEYACADSTLLHVLYSLLPLVQDKLNLLDPVQHPGAYGVLGASMGGLMATYTGLRLPHLFGRVFSQSGAFYFDEYEAVVGELVRHGPLRPLRLFMDVGQFEWLLEPNRRMHTLLRERGYTVAYREFAGGHNYPSWRNDLWRGLQWLFA
ncbi:MAG: esterase family protein [Chloroflexi bacterium]|nr:esterase family protein [Chloroflexota bacterium]